MKEMDLYYPVKNLLEDLGYVVKAEIGALDIMAVKESYVIAVELKLQISLKLIYQAIDRQKLADKVYVALPNTVIKAQKSHFKYFANLLKRLEIGLIMVSGNKAEVLVETFGFDLKKSIQNSKNNKLKLMKEFTLRKSDNIGGIKGSRMTHYKEKVIEIAKYLLEFGEKSPKDIKAYTGILDTPSILQKNYYGWFIKIDRGIYNLSITGKIELENYIDN